MQRQRWTLTPENIFIQSFILITRYSFYSSYNIFSSKSQNHLSSSSQTQCGNNVHTLSWNSTESIALTMQPRLYLITKDILKNSNQMHTKNSCTSKAKQDNRQLTPRVTSFRTCFTAFTVSFFCLPWHCSKMAKVIKFGFNSRSPICVYKMRMASKLPYKQTKVKSNSWILYLTT